MRHSPAPVPTTPAQATLREHLLALHGPLVPINGLATLLGRPVCSVHSSLSRPSDDTFKLLRDGRKSIGRRVYWSADFLSQLLG